MQNLHKNCLASIVIKLSGPYGAAALRGTCRALRAMVPAVPHTGGETRCLFNALWGEDILSSNYFYMDEDCNYLSSIYHIHSLLDAAVNADNLELGKLYLRFTNGRKRLALAAASQGAESLYRYTAMEGEEFLYNMAFYGQLNMLKRYWKPGVLTGLRYTSAVNNAAKLDYAEVVQFLVENCSGADADYGHFLTYELCASNCTKTIDYFKSIGLITADKLLSYAAKERRIGLCVKAKELGAADFRYMIKVTFHKKNCDMLRLLKRWGVPGLEEMYQKHKWGKEVK